MVRASWIKGLAAALVCVGGAWGQQGSSMPQNYNKGDTITLQEPGKGEQKVKVIKATRAKDGKMTYEVQDMETGDKAIISESPVADAMAETAPVKEKKSLFGLFSRKGNTSKKSDMSMKSQRANKAAKEKVGETIMIPASGVKDFSTGINPASGAMPKSKMLPSQGPSSKALPSNWQESWGKASEHRTDANMPSNIETVGYIQMAPDTRPSPCDGTVTVANCKVPGHPYWHVPQIVEHKPGTARVAR